MGLPDPYLRSSERSPSALPPPPLPPPPPTRAMQSRQQDDEFKSLGPRRGTGLHRKEGNYTFRSTFCSGNLLRVQQHVDQFGSSSDLRPRYRLWIAPDCVGTPFQNQYCIWYYFSAECTGDPPPREGQCVTMELMVSFRAEARGGGGRRERREADEVVGWGGRTEARFTHLEMSVTEQQPCSSRKRSRNSQRHRLDAPARLLRSSPTA